MVIILKMIIVKTNAIKPYPYVPPPSSLLIYYAEPTVTGPLQVLYCLSMTAFKSFSLFLLFQKVGYAIWASVSLGLSNLLISLVSSLSFLNL